MTEFCPNAGALLELEIAHKSRKQGKNVEFIPRKSEEGQKTPDLLIESILPMEIKELQMPEPMHEQHKIYTDIRDVIFQYQHDDGIWEACGRINRKLSESEKEKIIEKIENAVNKVKKGKSVEIESENPIGKDYEFFLVPKGEREKLEKWKEKRDFDGTLSGPPLKRHEKFRIGREIEEKIEQIPSEKPGALFFRVEITPFDDRKEVYLALLTSLQKEVYSHENLVSLIIDIKGGVSGEELINYVEGNFRIYEHEKKIGYGLKSYLILHNKMVEVEDKKELVNDIFETEKGLN